MDTRNLSGARVAVYARYSSDRQSESSIEDQVARCRRYVEDRAGTVDPALVFADYAVSGASLARPGFEQLMRAVEARRVDAIVTEDVSRVSRDLADAADLFKRLQYAQVQLLGVADGIDTSQRNASVTYHVKGLVAQLYLDDLRDKTLRGMEGRARAGLATGGVPYGYRTRPRDGGGFEIEIDADRAEIVRRIFAMYAAHRSQAEIAATLNAEDVPAPRAHSTRRRPGWVATAVRAILRNERYAGAWSFGARRWVKVPGTNLRRPQRRAEGEIVRLDRPELRIVDLDTWAAVAARFDAARPAPGTVDGRAKRRAYLLSGLLRCGACGALMGIHGGDSTRRYYRCSDARNRGTCRNRLSVAEGLVRPRVLEAIRRRFTSRAGVAEMRALVAEALGSVGREQDKDRRERTGRLKRTEDRIRALITMQLDGDRSEYTAELRRDLESQARNDRAALAALDAERSAARVLPSPDQLLAAALEVDQLVTADVVAGREALRSILDGGAITLTPREDGVYVARCGVLPLVLLGLHATTPAAVSRAGAFAQRGCGGRI